MTDTPRPYDFTDPQADRRTGGSPTMPDTPTGGLWRTTGEECPEGLPEASLENCLGCPYNRGASGLHARSARLLCNWPRNGSSIAAKALEQLPERWPVPPAYYDYDDSNDPV